MCFLCLFCFCLLSLWLVQPIPLLLPQITWNLTIGTYKRNWNFTTKNNHFFQSQIIYSFNSFHRYPPMSQALIKTGRPIFFSLCEWYIFFLYFFKIPAPPVIRNCYNWRLKKIVLHWKKGKKRMKFSMDITVLWK